ncbi:Unknown protein, partial [Striga hermonthica]
AYRGDVIPEEVTVPILTDEGVIKIYPSAILEKRMIKRKNSAVVQWLVQWVNMSKEEATWEDAIYIMKQFPEIQPPWGQGVSRGEGGVTH